MTSQGSSSETIPENPKSSATTQFNPTMEMYCTRGYDRKIHSAAFVQDLMVTIEVRWGYTQGMLGL